jgi:hypothetical protein
MMLHELPTGLRRYSPQRPRPEIEQNTNFRVAGDGEEFERSPTIDISAACSSISTS